LRGRGRHCAATPPPCHPGTRNVAQGTGGNGIAGKSDALAERDGNQGAGPKALIDLSNMPAVIRVQMDTPGGDFVGEIELMGEPMLPMWEFIKSHNKQAFPPAPAIKNVFVTFHDGAGRKHRLAYGGRSFTADDRSGMLTMAQVRRLRTMLNELFPVPQRSK
jgi:hypothetical protein